METDNPTLVPQPVQTESKRLNSLLPQVSQATLAALIAEATEADPVKLRAIYNERLDQLRRENFTLYSFLTAQTDIHQMAWVVFTYTALVAQDQHDLRYRA